MGVMVERSALGLAGSTCFMARHSPGGAELWTKDLRMGLFAMPPELADSVSVSRRAPIPDQQQERGLFRAWCPLDSGD